MIALENHMVLGDYLPNTRIPADCAISCENCGATFWDYELGGDIRHTILGTLCTRCIHHCAWCKDEQVERDGEVCPICRALMVDDCASVREWIRLQELMGGVK